MYRKQLRRRRAVLVLLVVAALVLLSTQFSESERGPLHSMQRAVASVFGPLEEGASRALKPARDLINWVDETFQARGENADLRNELEQLRTQLAKAQSAEGENQQLRDGPEGVAEPEVGDPSDLLRNFINANQPIEQGQMLVTAGWSNGAISSAYPPGIPIGKVSETSVGEQQPYQRVHVTPYADIRGLDFVQVATGGPERPGV